MSRDAQFMMRALELARRGEGLTRPNPPVGAVVVRNGKIIGEGFHRKAGGPHAEVMALDDAGTRARGATLYVTLEPCSTYGRTPPCTEKILQTGIKRVVVSVRDPNPKHAGRGLRKLAKAGIQVETNVCLDEGKTLIAPFTRWILDHRPYVTLKLAMTVDGKIGDRQRRSKWITGEPARAEVQALRRRADAILVGAGTVMADNPSLWPRPAKSHAPWRAVLDPDGLTSPTARVYRDEHASHTIVALGRDCSAARQAAYAKSGAEIIYVPKAPRAAVRSLMRQLGQRGLLHVLCEGGGFLSAALVGASLVDEFVFFIAPKIMGGDQSIGAVRGSGWPISQLPELDLVEMKKVGRDVMLRYAPRHRD